MKLKSMMSSTAAAVTVTCMALIGSAVQAQPRWSEKTILKFDSPVMIPGATLSPGTYVFRLADSQVNRNLMQVYTANEQDLVATTITVPIRRLEPKGDVVLKYARTDATEPVALKGFYYPGSLYGHEFVYSDKDARHIADTSHSVVLSRDVEGSDFQSGTLRTVDEAGQATAWTPDPDVARDWNVWIAEWRTVAPVTASDRQPAAVGTSGRTDAEAIQHLVDQALTQTGSTVTVDRSMLEEIRDLAQAIANPDASSRK